MHSFGSLDLTSTEMIKRWKESLSGAWKSYLSIIIFNESLDRIKELLKEIKKEIVNKKGVFVSDL